MLKAAFMNREVEKGRALDDAEARQVVSSLVKQRRDSIEQFLKGGRQDLVDKETAEIAILESYLPPAADPAVVDARGDRRDRRNRRDLAERHGPVMKAAMARLAGQTVDGKTVNELVRKKLRRRVAHGVGSESRPFLPTLQLLRPDRSPARPGSPAPPR